MIQNFIVATQCVAPIVKICIDCDVSNIWRNPIISFIKETIDIIISFILETINIIISFILDKIGIKISFILEIICIFAAD